MLRLAPDAPARAQTEHELVLPSKLELKWCQNVPDTHLCVGIRMAPAGATTLLYTRLLQHKIFVFFCRGRDLGTGASRVLRFAYEAHLCRTVCRMLARTCGVVLVSSSLS